MKRLLWMAGAALALAGCATNKGGTSDEYSTGYIQGPSESSSPAFRPGMTPNDRRDPNSLTTPQPHPTSPP